ncbi:MAG: DUF169 domain-containing protein [Proteobacteria bacterium]|nr:DUF169 domain-containing protein [Pseudomonadota bacterium]
MKIRPLQTDLSGFGRLNLERPPVGVKYLFFKPEGMEQLSLDKNLAFCEMLKEAQFADAPFYFSRENNETCVGKILLGMTDMEPFAEAGQIGPRLGMVQEARVNHNFYHHVPRLSKGIVNYVAFAPIDKLTFEPDVLIVTATTKQAEIVMRAMTYSTGEPYYSKTTIFMGCSWIYIYPFESGKMNYLIPEMIHGMNGRELFEPNTVLVSIPYQWLQTVAQNLREIKMVFHESKAEYLAEFEEILVDLIKESENP